MTDPARKRTTYAEYLEQELQSVGRHEFIEGTVVAMAGGSHNHALIASNIHGELYSVLKGRPCRPYGSDLRVFIETKGASTYPDVTVICGEPVYSGRDPHAPTNPTVLFEVGSPSTAEHDRTVKFDLYSTSEGLQHYVIVSYCAQRVEVLSPGEDGSWTLRCYRAEQSVDLPALGCSLPVEDIYAGTGLPGIDPELKRVDFAREILARYELSAGA